MQRENKSDTHTHTHLAGVWGGWVIRSHAGSHKRPFAQSWVSQMSQRKKNQASSATKLCDTFVRWLFLRFPKQWRIDSSGSTGSRRIQKQKKQLDAICLKTCECAVCQVWLWQGSGGSDGCGWCCVVEGVREMGGAVGCSSPSCQPPLSARRAGCVGRPGSSAADASPHVRGRQWPDGAPLALIPHWAISPSRWRAAAGAPLPDNYQASPQMEMSVSLTGPGSCHCLRPRPLYLSRALPTLTMCSVTAD